MQILEQLKSLVCHQQKPELKRPLRIGLCGAGNITRMHIEGFRWAGLEVVAITDLDVAKAEARAQEYQIPHVAPSLEAMLERKEVELIDINFPGNDRLSAVRKIVPTGRPILVQKPIAHDFAVSREIVEVCEQAGVSLAVNQNARFCPQYRTAKAIVSSGLLGDVYHALHHLSCNHDGMPHHAPWLINLERYQILQFGVHHLDQVCWWYGRMPRGVTAINTRKPGQQFRGEMLSTISLDFGDHAGASLLEFNALHATRPYQAAFEINGTRGALRGTHDGDLTLYHEELGEGNALTLKPTGIWFPNGFGEVMADFQNAIAAGTEPSVSGRANLPLLAMIEGCYQSIAERRTVLA